MRMVDGRAVPLRECLAVCATFACTCGALAQSTATEFSPQLWLNPGLYSYHFDRDKDLREDNIGLGAEFRFAEDHALVAGSFANSNRARSHYAGYMWRPLQWQGAILKLRAGVALGGFDGYPNYRGGGWFAAALPLLSVESGRLGVNLFVVPTLANRVDGAVAVQIQFRVW